MNDGKLDFIKEKIRKNINLDIMEIKEVFDEESGKFTDNVASCASTFAICNKGIEIQVNTKEEFKKKGLATVVCAALIIETINRGLDPHWDASNEVSFKLAKKLGYKEAETYEMIVYDK
jgi:predicted GNAT family acetyltransferase